MAGVVVGVSHGSSCFRSAVVENPWIPFWGTPSSSERRLLAACWTLRGKLESCVTPVNIDYSLLVLAHKLSFLIRFSRVMMVWEDELNSSSLYPFLFWLNCWGKGGEECLSTEIAVYLWCRKLNGFDLYLINQRIKNQPFLNQTSAQSPLAEIRPLMKAKRKKVTRPPPKTAAGLTLDSFLE